MHDRISHVFRLLDILVDSEKVKSVL